MSTLAEIENAVKELPVTQQEELLRHLEERLRNEPKPKRRFQVIPSSGRIITQQDIDDALDAD